MTELMTEQNTLDDSLQSPYLTKGFKEEEVKILKYQPNFKDKSISTKFIVQNPAAPHLTLITSYLALCNSLIPFPCLYFDKSKSEFGEMLQKKFTQNNDKIIILDDSPIQLDANCTIWEHNEKGLVRQVWKYEFNNKSFYGNIECLIKVPKGVRCEN
ncbi:MAG: hypothetical protein HRU03_01375 [Nanoarchaeales archaeon]|nr:hypothetical protein [Nanoarchaeales archaeon]